MTYLECGCSCSYRRAEYMEKEKEIQTSVECLLKSMSVECLLK